MLDTGLKICAAAVICAILVCVVRQGKQDMAFVVRLCAVVCLCGGVIAAAEPVTVFLQSLLDGVGSELFYASTLIKALGVAMLTQICATVCKECGEASAAYYAELGGKIEILILSLPLVSEVLGAARELVEML